jgi:hypothetical protein
VRGLVAACAGHGDRMGSRPTSMGLPAVARCDAAGGPGGGLPPSVDRLGSLD